jgi:hypothetical protein
MSTALLGTPLRRRALAAALAAALALGVAGCGDDGSTGAESGTPASFVPATAPLYVEASTDLDGPQWTQLEQLGRRFPAYPELRKQLTEELSSGGVDFERDVKPLLGEVAAIAATKLPSGLTVPALPGSGTTPSIPSIPSLEDGEGFVAALEIAAGKEEAVRELIRKEAQGQKPAGEHAGVQYFADGDDQSVAAVADRVLLIAGREADLFAAIDAHQAGGARTLAGVDRVTDTLAKLPRDAVLTGYLDAGALVRQAAAESDQLRQLEQLGLSRDAAVGFSVTAEEHGLRFTAVVTGSGAQSLAGSEAFAPRLTRNVPGDALAYVGFRNLAGSVEQTLRTLSTASPDFKAQLDALSAQLPLVLGGASLDDLRALAEGEHALVVTKGGAYPTGSLLLAVKDEARARRTLDAVRNAVPLLASQLEGGRQLPDWKQVTNAGATGWQLPLSDKAGVVYGVRDGLAVIGTQPASLGLLSSPVTNLAQDADYAAATTGMPDSVESVVWVDVRGIVELADSLGAFANGDANAQRARENLRPLKSFAAWSTVEDGVSTVEARLTIE